MVCSFSAKLLVNYVLWLGTCTAPPGLTFMNNKSIPVSAMGLELGLIDIYGIGPNNLDANNTTDGMSSVPSGPGAPTDERPDPPEGGSGPRP